MKRKYKLTVKYTENTSHIIYEDENGCYEIARILFLRDNQIADNIECTEGIKTLIRRRINKSS